MSKYQYKKKSRFHITDQEAQVIGDAFEKCGSRTGAKGVSVEKFENFCAKRQHPVHKIWERQRDQIADGAGRTAAAYLMRAVEIIIIHPKKQAGPAGRAITTIMIENEAGDYNGVGFRSEDVARRPDLLDLAEEEMDRQVRGLAESFAAVAGGNRMYARLLKIATEVRELFGAARAPKSKKKRSGVRTKEKRA